MTAFAGPVSLQIRYYVHMETRRMAFIRPHDLADRFVEAVLSRNDGRAGAIFGDREAV